jgi:hypothetical protein
MRSAQPTRLEHKVGSPLFGASAQLYSIASAFRLAERQLRREEDISIRQVAAPAVSPISRDSLVEARIEREYESNGDTEDADATVLVFGKA